MSVFTSSFFSVAGQVERLTNVVNVVKSAINPFDSNTIKANVSNPVAKAGLEFVANNPYSTAAVIATAGSSTARTAVAKVVTSLSTTTKVIAGGAALVAVPAIVSSPKIQGVTVNTISSITPEKLVKLGSGIGKVTEAATVSSGIDFLKENKGVLGVVGGVTAAIVGAKVAAPLVNYMNIRATQQNTGALQNNNNLGIEQSKSDLKITEVQSESAFDIAKLQAKASIDLAKQETEKQIALAKEQTKQAELVSKLQATPTMPSVAPIKKATKKKKKVTKKKKKAPKKKKKAPKKKKSLNKKKKRKRK